MEWVAWMVPLVVVAVDWWMTLDQRRLDSRALAEGLRVRRAWAMAGIGRSVADTYLGQIRSELSWIRLAVQHASLRYPVFYGNQGVAI